MTTAQEPLTNAIPPFPFFIENPVVPHRNDLPANKANNNQCASDDQVVGRQKGVPITPLLAHEKVPIDTNPLPERCQFADPIRIGVPSDEPERGISPEPLPERCQFFFSDGRQCRMARSEIHPSRCPFHAEREDQLFGDPAPGGHVVGAALDLSELYSACRDLTTAAGVNHALGQVFRLLAQRRISRQEAATFGHLAQLLLRSISAMRLEFVAGPADQQGQQVEQPSSSRESPRRERHGDQELRGVNKVVPSEYREPRRAVCVPDGFAGDLSFGSPQPQPSTACVPSAEDPVAAGKQPAPAADASSAAVAERAVQRKPIPTASVDEGSTSSRSLPVAHAAPPNPQPSRNEHLRNRHPQVAHNEHLQNLET